MALGKARAPVQGSGLEVQGSGLRVFTVSDFRFGIQCLKAPFDKDFGGTA